MIANSHDSDIPSSTQSLLAVHLRCQLFTLGLHFPSIIAWITFTKSLWIWIKLGVSVPVISGMTSNWPASNGPASGCTMKVLPLKIDGTCEDLIYLLKNLHAFLRVFFYFFSLFNLLTWFKCCDIKCLSCIWLQKWDTCGYEGVLWTMKNQNLDSAGTEIVKPKDIVRAPSVFKFIIHGVKGFSLSPSWWFSDSTRLW